MKNWTKKAIANSLWKEAEKELTNMSQKPNNILKPMKFMKKDWKDILGRCIRDKDGEFGFSEKDRKRTCKNHMKEIMNKENDWAHMTEVNMVEGLIGKVIHEEMVIGAMA